MIKRFRISNLFGFRTADITFEDNIKILIGENGLGKTTVLNSLYYLLNQMYSKLVQVDFENIELEFINNKKIKFNKLELENYLEFKQNRNRRRIPLSIVKHLEQLDMNKLKNIPDITPRMSRKTRDLVNDFIHENNIPKFAPSDIMIREILRYSNEPTFENFNIFNTILKELNFSILYFPTYRRVEEDLKNLGRFKRRVDHISNDETFYEAIEEDIEVTDDTLIHFGMEDVEARIKRIESEINKSTISGFSKVTGEMLSQLLKGFPNIEDKAVEELDENSVKIILHRVGNNLSEHDRQNILTLLENKDSLKEKKELVYFIYKLIDIYNQHKHLDDAVKNFRDICNKYLGDKQFKYEESSVDLDIYRNNNKEKVSLSKLSSGEKQIISIFSKIFLEDKDNLIVLFDEPELSLSLPWQELLLPDIINSGKCKFLLSVTHSPFIFKNELEKFAIGMNTYIKESN